MLRGFGLEQLALTKKNSLLFFLTGNKNIFDVFIPSQSRHLQRSSPLLLQFDACLFRMWHPIGLGKVQPLLQTDELCWELWNAARLRRCRGALWKTFITCHRGFVQLRVSSVTSGWWQWPLSSQCEGNKPPGETWIFVFFVDQSSATKLIWVTLSFCDSPESSSTFFLFLFLV